MDWDDYFIRLAFLISEKSKDRSAKIGAVIVGPDNEIRTTGFNGFPRGVDDSVEERHQRPMKYQYTEHGERNAILNAARHGAALRGCRMYLNWEPYPCPDCARAVIQAGIVEVIGPNRPFGGTKKNTSSDENQIDWQETFKATKQMFQEASVATRIVEFEEDV